MIKSVWDSGDTLPDARIPDGRIPDARIPDARIPDGRIPDARIPDASTHDDSTHGDSKQEKAASRRLCSLCYFSMDSNIAAFVSSSARLFQFSSHASTPSIISFSTSSPMM